MATAASHWHGLGGRGLRRLAGLVLGLALAWGVLLFGAPSASAHALLVTSAPADGAVLATPPAQVVLHFSEAVQVRPDGVRVLDVHGVNVDSGGARHASASDTVTVDVRPRLPTGTYFVSWRVVSDDSHPVSGGLLFGVGTAPDASAAFREPAAGGTQVLGVLAGLARALGYAGVALAVGATAFLVLIGPRPGRRGMSGRLPAVGLIALAAGTVFQFCVQGAQAGGDGVAGLGSPADLADTAGGPLGVVLAVRALLIVLAAVTVPRLLSAQFNPRKGPGLLIAVPAAFLGVGLAVTVALAGHARAGPVLGVASWTMHVLAMSIWLGGLAVLALAAARVRGDIEGEAALLARMPRWSQLARVSVAVLAVTGAYQMWRQVDGLHALVATAYGRLLGVKLALVAVMLIAGVAVHGRLRRRYAEAAPAATAWRVPVSASSLRPASAPVGARLASAWPAGADPVPAGESRRVAGGGGPADEDPRQLGGPARRGPARPLRAWVRAELLVGALVLAVTAALVGQAPATGAARVPVPEAPAFEDRAPAGPFTVLIRVAPTVRGPQDVSVRVVDSAGAPAAVKQVTGRLALPDRDIGPFRVTFRPSGGSEFTGRALAAFPGRWELSLSVQLDALTDYVTLSTYDVG